MDLSLRDDDSAILEEVAQRTGMGSINARSRKAGSNPQKRWRVRGKKDRQILIDLLDRYPLRSKKKRDFLLWREAVLLFEEADRGDRSIDVRMTQIVGELKNLHKYLCL